MKAEEKKSLKISARLIDLIKKSTFIYLQFNIHCLDDYQLALIGTIGNIARFTFLPITGLLSDR